MEKMVSNRKGYYKEYGNKLYGPYHYDRGVHLFTEKDVARIAKVVAKRNGTNGAVKVFAAVAVALGFGALICKTARTVRSYISITSWLKDLSAILATSLIITVAIEFLMAVKLVAPSWVKIIVALAIAACFWMQKVLDVIPTITNDIAVAQEVSVTIDGWCKAVDDFVGDTFDGFCDATGDTCETAKQLSKDAAHAMKSDVDKAWETLGLEDYPKWWEWL